MINHQNRFPLYNLLGKGQITLTSILSQQLISRKENIIARVSNTAIENTNWNILWKASVVLEILLSSVPQGVSLPTKQKLFASSNSLRSSFSTGKPCLVRLVFFL